MNYVKIISIILCLCLNLTFGEDYYCDCSYNDDNGDGSYNTPWNKFASIESFAHTGFEPGDNLYFKRGTICRGVFKLYKWSGSENSPITLDAYGTGSMPILDGDGDQSALYLMGGSYLTIQNLEIQNKSSSPGKRRGIFVEPWQESVPFGIKIINNVIRNVDGIISHPVIRDCAGIYLKNNGDGTMNNILIEGNQLYDLNSIGIRFHGENHNDGSMDWSLLSSNVVIRGNIVRRTAGDGIVVWGTNNVLIEYNIVDGAGKLGNSSTPPIGGIWEMCSRGGIIQYNEVCNTKVWASDGFGFHHDVVHAGTTIFQYNYSHDNEGGFISTGWPHPYDSESEPPNVIYRYNLSVNDKNESTLIDFENSEKAIIAYGNANVEFYNNTIYTDVPFVITYAPNRDYLFDGDYEVKFVNNIFFSTEQNKFNFEAYHFSDHPFTDNLAYFSNNLYKTGFGNGNDENPFFDEQPFRNPGESGEGFSHILNYKLKGDSEAIGAGMKIENSGERDIRGYSLYGNTDIGVFDNLIVTPIISSPLLLN